MKTWKNNYLKECAVEIELPSTPGEWEIYSGMTGVDQVAKRLTGALQRTLRRLDTLHKKGSGVEDAAYDAMDDMMFPALSKYREYGASDTEPAWVAKDCVRKYAMKRGLISEYYHLF